MNLTYFLNHFFNQYVIFAQIEVKDNLRSIFIRKSIEFSNQTE